MSPSIVAGDQTAPWRLKMYKHNIEHYIWNTPEEDDECYMCVPVYATQQVLESWGGSFKGATVFLHPD